jgi:hypothetical protein
MHGGDGDGDGVGIGDDSVDRIGRNSQTTATSSLMLLGRLPQGYRHDLS